MAIIKYWHNNQCALRYKTDIDEYNEFWYNDTKDILKDYEFIVIDSLAVPMEIGNTEVIHFLKEFCRLMTVGNKIVIYDNEEFMRYLDSTGSGLYYDACSTILDEILIKAGFDCIQAFEYSYNYKDVYIYTASKLGMPVYNIIMKYYGYEDE